MAAATNNTKAASEGNVFDVPDDFPNHPGGQGTLQSAREAKNKDHKDIMFLAYHLGCDLDGRIAKMAKAKGIVLPERGEIYNEIHKAVLQIQKDHPHEVLKYEAWCIFTTVLFWSSLLGFNLTASPVWAGIFCFCVVSYAFNIFHMRNHRGGKLYRSDFLNRLTWPLYEVMDRTFAIQPEAWIDHHNNCHHMDTNDAVLDYDVYSPPFRLHPAENYYWYYRFQPLYVNIMLALSALTFPWDNWWAYKGSFAHLALYYMTMFIMPTYFHGWVAFVRMFKAGMVMSFLISTCIQVSHNHKGLQFSSQKTDSSDNAPTNKMDDYILLQLNECMSWGGYWECLLVGGNNYQLEHHIAPALCPMYLHYLSIYLKDMATRRGWNYVYEPNCLAVLYTYNEHIYRMSLPPNEITKTDPLKN